MRTPKKNDATGSGSFGPRIALLICSARITMADGSRMVELREETGVQRSLTERLVRSRLQWVGHVERMADDRQPKLESGRVS